MGRIVALAVLTALAGCTAGPRAKFEPTFFPSPPSLPRVQFLGGFSDSTDVEGKDTSFSLFGDWKGEGKKTMPIFRPYGITAAGGTIYLCDLGVAKVIAVNLVNKTFAYLKGTTGPGALKSPVNVKVDRNGFIYVADTLRKDVVEYDPSGEFFRALGGDVEMKPVDVAIDADNLYVLDGKNNEIKVFDLKSGAMTSSFGKSQNPEEALALPTNMAMDKDGFLYVTNVGSGKVMKFDRDGHLVSSFGKLGDGFGEFARPKGIAVDSNGYILVADAGFQNVQMFNPEGRLLMFFGEPNNLSQARGAMDLPAGIAVTTDNLEYFQKLAAPSFKLESVILVANQVGAPKVSIYGMGKREGIDYEKEYERIRTEREKKVRELREKEEKLEKEKKEREEKGGAAAPAAK
jgi:streptogramin lyase